MSLIEKTLYETIDKVARSIKRIKHFEPPEGYHLAFSGGKDSVVIHKLAEMAGVEFTAHYSYPGLDPRPLVNFIKREYPEVVFHYPSGLTYGKRFVKYAMPPLRHKRWCCQLLKEGQGQGVIILGIRWAESRNRKNRQTIEVCTNKTLFCPILEWTNADVWEFIHKYELPYCRLYNEGFKRLGCVCCPVVNEKQRRAELTRFPKFANMFRVLFKRTFKARQERGIKQVHKTANDWFEWWLGHRQSIDIEGQCYLFDN